MRQAIVDITPEALPECVSVLRDAGINVVRSQAPAAGRDLVSLIVEGDALPFECAQGPLKRVQVEIRRETYGAQRIDRISKISIVE